MSTDSLPPEETIRQHLLVYCKTGAIGAAIVAVYGLMSLILGSHCVSSDNPRWFHAMVPLIVSGLGFIQIGVTWLVRSLRMYRKCTSAPLAEDILGHHKMVVEQEARTTGRIRSAGEIVLVMGVVLTVLSLLWNPMYNSLGAWLVLAVQGAVATILALMVINRNAIHLHEIDRMLR